MVSNNFQQGLQNFNQKNYQEALKFFDLAAQENSKNSGIYYYKGICLKNLKSYSEAIKNFDRCTEIYEKYVNAYVEKGYILIKQGKKTEAQQCFTKVLTLDPTPNRQQQLGLGFLLLGEMGKANEAFQQVIPMHPQPIEALTYQGIVFIVQNKLDLAEKNFQKAFEINTQKSIIAQCLQGYVQILKSSHKNALAQLKTVIEQDKSQFLGYLFRAESCFIENQFKSGVEELEFAVEYLQEDKYPFLSNEKVQEVQKFIVQLQNINKMIDQLQQPLKNSNFDQKHNNLGQNFIKQIQQYLRQQAINKIDQLLVFTIETLEGKYKQLDSSSEEITNLLNQVLQQFKDNQNEEAIVTSLKKYLNDNKSFSLIPNRLQNQRNSNRICNCSIF